MINLDKEGVTTFNASAEVVCDTGFNTTTPQIQCLENGSWAVAECIIKGKNLHSFPKFILGIFCNGI